MERIPLRRVGPSTPDFVDKILSAFGKNPHGEANFRLIWSENKFAFFMGEMVPEYAYLAHPCWVLERWLSPDKDAGSEFMWSMQMEQFMGPYPRYGTFMFSEGFPLNWTPSEVSVQAIAAGLLASTDIPMDQRENAIRATLEHKAAIARQKVADEIVELQDSASMGFIQQSVSGPKNTFRTPDDFGRDRDREKAIPGMPTRGGKLLN
jgi:hypothetical protein